MNQLNFEYASLSEESEFISDHKSEYIQETISDIINHQPIIVETEIATGNFDILLLVDNYQFINKLDCSGYTPLHHAISYQRSDVIRFLLSKGANPNIKSKLKQSCLMMACNFGMIDMVKLFIDMGGDIHEVDELQYTALLYAFKGKQRLIALYLISLGAKTNIVDGQGCSLMHWAAYNNDVYLIKLMENMDYPIRDKQQLSPLDRAERNYSYHAINYLKQKDQNNSKSQCIWKYICFITYFILCIVDMINFKGEDKMSFYIQLSYIIQGIYTIIYTILFMKRVTNKYNEGQPINQKLGHPNIHFECTHGEEHVSLQLSPQNEERFSDNLYDQIKEYFTNEEFDKSFDISKTCSKCVKIKQKQEFHCEYCNSCVPGFQFHSQFLQKCINNTNHLFYVLLLLTYQFLIILHLFYYYYQHSDTYLILLPFYTIYMYPLSMVLIQSILFTCLSLLILVNFYAILMNNTIHELLYPEQYEYLYRIVEFGSFYYKVLIGIDNLIENIQDYIWNQFNTLRVK